MNIATLIGNLTRDPELRYTPQGTAVCTFGLATNRQWVTEAGEKKEDAEFHRIVAWNKLAEICSQLLRKGRKVYVEGRLQTRSWTGQDGNPRNATEIVITDMIILDPKQAVAPVDEFDIPEPEVGTTHEEAQVNDNAEQQKSSSSSPKPKKDKKDSKSLKNDEPTPAKASEDDEEIPF